MKIKTVFPSLRVFRVLGKLKRFSWGAALMLGVSVSCTISEAALTEIGPFSGTLTEKWEAFTSGSYLSSPTSIMSRGAEVTSSSTMYIYEPGVNDLPLLYAQAKVADGVLGMGLRGVNQSETIHFNSPVSQFGAYWTAGTQGQNFYESGAWAVKLIFSDATFESLVLSIAGEDSNAGELKWFGWSSDVSISEIIISGSYVAIDGLQADLAAVPEPSTFIAGALLAVPFGIQGIRYLRNRKRAV